MDEIMEMMMNTIPPFTISVEAINRIAEISALVEHYAMRLAQKDGLRLRRANRIKTIHSSLAIEGNTLSEDEVRDILDGKNVVAPIKQIQEVKNAIKTYELYPSLDAFNEKDLLKAHGVMMEALVDNAGSYRRGGVGVYGAKGLVHLAPPADRVPVLMHDLFDWLKHAKDHLLIRSCVFHFEFEFIHPFIDGNGRMGRLWQSLILGKLHPLFEHLPVENMVYSNQQQYYDAIKASTSAGQSGPFIDFMLSEIHKTLLAHKGEPLQHKLHDKLHDKFPELSEKAIAVLGAIHAHRHFNAAELGEHVGLSERQVKTYISKLKQAGLLVRVGSNKTGYWQLSVDVEKDAMT